MFCMGAIKVMRKGQIFAFSSHRRCHHLLPGRTFRNGFSVTGRVNSSLNLKINKRVICKVAFHTSPPRGNPQIWVMILNMLRSLAVSTGRSFQGGSNGGKPPIRPGTIAAGGIFATFLGLLFYRTHLQECPITKRRKFIMFSDQTIRKMAAEESVKIQNKFRARLVKSGEEYRHVMGISSRILSANQSLPGIKREWRVFVIEDKRTLNAFVLPNGHIFVFSGMIKAVTNEDQLATVLGHEIAHALLNHVGEQISKTFFFELLLLLPVALLWVVLPDTAAIFSQRLAEYMHTVLFKLPMSRQLETEADVVGLRMMARACYDPREAVQLWNMMARMSKGESVEWLSTHPSHTTRSQTLQQYMQEAMGIRAKHCK